MTMRVRIKHMDAVSSYGLAVEEHNVGRLTSRTVLTAGQELDFWIHSGRSLLVEEVAPETTAPTTAGEGSGS